MKKIFFIMILSLVFWACDNKDNERTGFTIKGKIGELNEPSMAYLTYETIDSTLVDSTTIKDGQFQFIGEVSEPRNAYIEVRHGKTFPEESWDRDSYGFLLENANLKISASDSISNASLSGSVLNEQEKKINSQISPLREKLSEIGWRYKKNPEADGLEQARDSSQLLKEKMLDIYNGFINSNRDSYVALQYFSRINLSGYFDATEVEEDFNKFSETLKSSEFGQEVLGKIKSAKKSEEGAKVEDFTQTTIDGETFTFSSTKGNYVLVEFWASWCAPCRAENPNLKNIYKKYEDRNFEIVGISLDESRKAWENAVKVDDVPWIQVSDLQGFDNELAKTYDIRAIPQNFLVNPEGVIIAKNLRGEELAARVDEIFKNQK